MTGSKIDGFRLGIYVFEDAEVVDLAAPYGVFSVARRYHPALDVFLVAETLRPVQAQAGFTVLPNYDFAGTITGGRLADRFGRLPVIRASFAVTAAGLAAIVVTGLPWVFRAIALTGFALNQSFSLTVTLGQDYLPTRIGTSSGVTLGLAISVGGLVTPALGALADATSLHLAVTVLAAFRLLGLALALRLRRPRLEGTSPGVPPCNSAPRL